MRLSLNNLPAAALLVPPMQLGFNNTQPQYLCRCLRVTEGEVREAVAVSNAETVRGVTQACGAGGGCMACHRHIKRVLAEQQAQIAAEANCPAQLGFA